MLRNSCWKMSYYAVPELIDIVFAWGNFLFFLLPTMLMYATAYSWVTVIHKGDIFSWWEIFSFRWTKFIFPSHIAYEMYTFFWIHVSVHNSHPPNPRNYPKLHISLKGFCHEQRLFSINRVLMYLLPWTQSCQIWIFLTRTF